MRIESQSPDERSADARDPEENRTRERPERPERPKRPVSRGEAWKMKLRERVEVVRWQSIAEGVR